MDSFVLSDADVKAGLEDVDKLNVELDDVADMLSRLASKDKEVAVKAVADVDAYLSAKERCQREGYEDGCRVKADKTLVNRESDLERRRRISDELKEEGNAFFKSRDYAKAKERYTGAILQYDQNPALFTNRAQTFLQLEEFFRCPTGLRNRHQTQTRFRQSLHPLGQGLQRTEKPEEGAGSSRRGRIHLQRHGDRHTQVQVGH